MNPNHRMPALVDHNPADGGEPFAVFESGAIMMYIAEKAGKFFPQDPRGKYRGDRVADLADGQPGPEDRRVRPLPPPRRQQGDQSYAVRRFTDEVNRLYGVLNNRLYESRYLAGDEYTIADMISYPWTVNWKAQGQDIEEFKYFKRWFEEIGARPGVQRGMAVGADLSEDPSKLPPEEQDRRAKILYNQRARPVPA